MRTTRRDILQMLAAMGVSALGAETAMPSPLPQRRIPGTSESLPIIGLGSTKAVDQILADGAAPLTAVVRTLIARHGRVLDTWPQHSANDAVLGTILAQPDITRSLFVTTKIDQPGRKAGIAQFRQTQKDYGRKQFDLAQVMSLKDVQDHWATLKALKANGEARYIGVTVSNYGLYNELERFLRAEKPDFMQVNYSVSERKAEEQVLPLARDHGVGVIINRPFMNGDFFKRLQNKPLPSFAAEIGCDNWAAFSLKYILPNRAVTCVLTETTNPQHLAENIDAACGAMPDDAMRKRMATVIDTI